jgi:hypothetical protein
MEELSQKGSMQRCVKSVFNPVKETIRYPVDFLPACRHQIPAHAS